MEITVQTSIVWKLWALDYFPILYSKSRMTPHTGDYDCVDPGTQLPNLELPLNSNTTCRTPVAYIPPNFYMELPVEPVLSNFYIVIA